MGSGLRNDVSYPGNLRRHHRGCDLALAEDDLRRAILRKVLGLGIRKRPRDDRDRRVDGARLGNDLAALEIIRTGDEEATRLAEVRRSGNLRVGGIAVDRLDPLAPEGGDLLGIRLDDDVGHRAFRQSRADELTHFPIADEHDVIRQRGGRHRFPRGLIRRLQPRRRSRLARTQETFGQP